MNYSDSFLKALEFTLRWEGGYSNNPNDSGGATNKGITQAVYDKYRDSKHVPRLSVKRLDDDEMKEIYFINYWSKAKCYSYPTKLGIALFDFAVNSGVNRALAYLQSSNNDLDTYLNERKEFFKAISTGHNSVFLKGWLNRLASLRSFLSGMVE